MYTYLLFIHSWNRWLILISLALGLIALAQGLIKKSEALSKLEVIGQKSFVGLLDLQFLLGFWLLMVTPLMAGGNVHPWLFHHGGGMFIAVAIAHTANSIGKKKPSVQQQRKTYLIGNIITLLVIFGSVPWPFSSFARPLFRGF